MEDEIEYWITTEKGAHIPVKRGQTKEEALNEFLRAKGDPRGKSIKQLKYEQEIELKKQIAKMSSVDWALFYDAISGIKTGNHVSVDEDGNYIIPIYQTENVHVSKVVISTPDYENPRVVKIIFFRSPELLEDFMRRI